MVHIKKKKNLKKKGGEVIRKTICIDTDPHADSSGPTCRLCALEKVTKSL